MPNIHTYKLGEGHIVDGSTECWCKPIHGVPCPDCALFERGCATCKGSGFVDPQPGDDHCVIHNSPIEELRRLIQQQVRNRFLIELEGGSARHSVDLFMFKKVAPNYNTVDLPREQKNISRLVALAKEKDPTGFNRLWEEFVNSFKPT